MSGERAPLPHYERDRFVFSDSDWPTARARELPRKAGWHVRAGHVMRRLTVCDEDAKEDAPGHNLWEAMLRFPNAPIYGTHSPRAHLYELRDKWPNYHTMRVIGVGDRPPRRVRHVYLLHNGLNETSDLLFHYRLAAWILNDREDAVCILRPLPGHLTRYPFDGPFAEQPLDGYLRDPAELFRQFLRYMVETGWLLSALVPRSHYAVEAGAALSADVVPSGDGAVGRADDKTLAKTIGREWREAFQRSQDRRAEMSEEQGRLQYSKSQIKDVDLEQAFGELRKLLGWRPVLGPARPSPPTDERGAGVEPPSIHVVGYSMGGFMAQAAFFSWPYAIASCTNLFAGGALRDLAPTAFAHPEEWQAVLHGLRYELDRALQSRFLAPNSKGQVVGMREEHFGYLKRVFYEVFLQYYRGGYSSRVREFSRRLLFVVGGSDPIVRTKNVLDAGPPGGMTLLQLADLSHFQSPKAGQSTERAAIEKEQRKLWLPEVGGVIGRFSERSARALQATLAESWIENGSTRTRSRRAGYAELEVADTDRANSLDSAAFERELDRIVDLVDTGSDKSGVLMISRNELPPVFLGPQGFRSHGGALHHSEDLITRYTVALERRAERLRHKIDRVSLIVPEQAREWFTKPAEQFALFAKSETPGAGRTPAIADLEAMWQQFEREWVAAGAVSFARAGEYLRDRLRDIGVPVAERHRLETIPLTILPDVWIGLSYSLCARLRGQHGDEREHILDEVVDWAAGLARRSEEASEWLEHALRNDELRVIKVSAAELNPRYRGQRVVAARLASRALIHWALAYRASSSVR